MTLIGYHGTNKPFDKPTKFQLRRTNFGPGLYFATVPETAAEFSAGRNEPLVYAATVTLESPLVMSPETPEAVIQKLCKAFRIPDDNLGFGGSKILEIFGLLQTLAEMDPSEVRRQQIILQRLGYDGTYISNELVNESWRQTSAKEIQGDFFAVFTPEQILSWDVVPGLPSRYARKNPGRVCSYQEHQRNFDRPKAWKNIRPGEDEPGFTTAMYAECRKCNSTMIIRGGDPEFDGGEVDCSGWLPSTENPPKKELDEKTRFRIRRECQAIAIDIALDLGVDAEGIARIEDTLILESRRRSLSRMGYAHIRRNSITLNLGYLTTAEKYRATLLHEYAHIIQYRLPEAIGVPVLPHGDEWKRVMRAMGLPTKATAGDEYTLPASVSAYSLECAKCRWVYPVGHKRYEKALRDPSHFRHPRCGGEMHARKRKGKGK